MLPPSDCRDAYIPAAAVAMEYMMKGKEGEGEGGIWGGWLVWSSICVGVGVEKGKLES